MKKLSLFLIACLALSLTACNFNSKEAERNAAKIDSLREALAQSENNSNDLMSLVDEIQNGFRAINESEGIVTTQVGEGEGSNRQAIASNMKLIQKRLSDNRMLVKKLQYQVSKMRSQNAKAKSAMQNLIKDFEKQLQEKQEQLEKLTEELQQKNLRIQQQSDSIATLSDGVSQLSEENQTQKKNLAAQDKKMHTVYFVFGSKKELRRQKIITRQGVLKSDDFNRDYFQPADSREIEFIPLYSKKAKLETSHPDDSYTLEKGEDKKLTLHILNPKKFWSVSKFLVVVVH